MTSDTIPNTINWSELYIAAESMQEPFQDVVIITARQAFFERADEMASEALHGTSRAVPTDDVHQTIVHELVAKSQVTIQEYVNVKSDTATICVNVPALTDDTVMWKALDMLSHALEQLDGTEGTVYFGEPLRFSMLDKPM